jgi:hypothetical protein
LRSDTAVRVAWDGNRFPNADAIMVVYRDIMIDPSKKTAQQIRARPKNRSRRVRDFFVYIAIGTFVAGLAILIGVLEVSARRQMQVAFTGLRISAIAAFVWASLDYNRFIKFWMVRPAPYRKRIKIVFRLFFLACVVGGARDLAETIRKSHQNLTAYVPALPFAAVSCLILYLLVRVVERMAETHWERRSR